MTEVSSSNSRWPLPLRVAIGVHLAATFILLIAGQLTSQSLIDTGGGVLLDAVLALQLSQVMLVGTWRALGSGVPWRRMLVSYALLGAGAGIALAAIRNVGAIVLQQLMLFDVALAVLLYTGNTGLLLVLAKFGWKAVRVSEDAAPQFGVRHLLFAMLAVGLLLGLCLYQADAGRDRYEVAEDLENAGLRYDATVLILLSYASLLAILIEGRLLPRLGLLLAAVFVAGYFQGWPLGGRFVVFFAVFVATTLLAVRAAGYRIERQTGRRPAHEPSV